MRISKVIELLNAIKEKEGDIRVKIFDADEAPLRNVESITYLSIDADNEVHSPCALFE